MFMDSRSVYVGHFSSICQDISLEYNVKCIPEVKNTHCLVVLKLNK